MSSSPTRAVISARYIFPLGQPPLAGGRLAWEDGIVRAVGPAQPADPAPAADAEGDGQAVTEGEAPPAEEPDWTFGPAEDWGPVAVLPGLINAHTHLEFSDLGEPLPAGKTFPDWVRTLVQHRREHPARGSQAVASGLEQSIQRGVVCLGEIAQDDWAPEPFAESPATAVVFLEMLGLQPDRIAERLEVAEKHLRRRKHRSHWTPGLSPHAPYSVHPDLLAKLVDLAVEYEVPLAMHLAESAEEIELLATGKGPFRTLLEDWGLWQADLFPGNQRPLNFLEKLAAAPHSLVIHGNYLDEAEIQFLTEHRDRFTVVYCPRTHHFFDHPEHPLPQLVDAKVRVAVGTDSRASNPDLSLLAELQTIARVFPQIDGGTILGMGTLAAAEALGNAQELGSIEPGKQATFTIVSLPDYDARDPYELLWDDNCRVIGTMIEGKWVYRHEEELSRR